MIHSNKIKIEESKNKQKPSKHKANKNNNKSTLTDIYTSPQKPQPKKYHMLSSDYSDC